jgi:ribonuclease HII
VSATAPPSTPPSSKSLPPLTELRHRYVELARPLPSAIEATLREDPRPGARAILDAVEKRRHARRAEGQRLRRMTRYEEELWRTGVVHVAGVDEAGMSPLAGPVAAGAVVLRVGARIPFVDDSKKLDRKMRERLADVIRVEAVAWAVAFAEHDEIDSINIYWAGLLAMRRAVLALAVPAQHLLLDARRLKDVELPQQRIVHGDAKSLSIAAASILAKVARDARMRELDALYPGYGFSRHKGYPVKEHVEALSRLGPCPVHRRSFAPVRDALGTVSPVSAAPREGG